MFQVSGRIHPNFLWQSCPRPIHLRRNPWGNCHQQYLPNSDISSSLLDKLVSIDLKQPKTIWKSFEDLLRIVLEYHLASGEIPQSWKSPDLTNRKGQKHPISALGMKQTFTREMSAFLKQPQRCSLHDTSPYLYPPTQCQYTPPESQPQRETGHWFFRRKFQISKKHPSTLWKGSSLAPYHFFSGDFLRTKARCQQSWQDRLLGHRHLCRRVLW